MYATIVLPAFNEEDCIGPLLREIREKIKGLPVREIVLVDDGSTDTTAARAMAAWGVDEVTLRIIRHGRRQGQSRALLTGIRAASQDLIVTLDADGQNDPADIATLISTYAARQQRTARMIVAGQRKRRQDTLVKRVSSRLANRIRASLLDDNVRDTGLQPETVSPPGFSRAAVLRSHPSLHSRDDEGVGVAVVLVDVGHRPREAGTSKYGFWDRLWVGIYDLVGVRWLLKRQIANVELETVQ